MVVFSTRTISSIIRRSNAVSRIVMVPSRLLVFFGITGCKDHQPDLLSESVQRSK
jgi:hypothetical protein